MSTCSDGFSTVWIDAGLAVGAMPCKEEHLGLLRRDGVSAVLNLCAEFCDLADLERTHGFAMRFLPIDDDGVPDPGELDQALAWVRERLEAGEKVYIHCRFGMGRTGTVLYCLLALRGLSRREVEALGADWPARPMNPLQWRFVTGFAKRHACPGWDDGPGAWLRRVLGRG